ncbi:MAG: fumarylacetoacetate hydrolase family protein, partial [Dehalococcoidia bacterium]
LTHDEGSIVDLNAAYALHLAQEESDPNPQAVADVLLPPYMITFLERGEKGRQAAETALAFASREMAKGQPPVGRNGARIVFAAAAVRLRAPVPRPRRLRDFLAFEEHASRGGQRQLPKEWYEMPVFYKGNPDAVIGPDEEIPWPSYTQQLDLELELGIVIGRQGHSIPKEEAMRHVFGYTIFNDVSARDIQGREMNARLGPAKGKDFCNVFGPCIVTADEVDDMNLRMIARINGETWCDNNSGTRRYTTADVIAWASLEETIHPGEVLGSGTVGKGSGAEQDRWISPGDLIELEIEGIGVLRNRVGHPRRD